MASKLSIWFRGQRSTLSKDTITELERCKGAVWFHAASVGEFEQARPIIERLKGVKSEGVKELKSEGVKVVVTFFSPSGYNARKGYELADGVFYLPLPTRYNAKRFLDALQPKMAIFVKYEFWPAYLKELKKRSIPTYSICAIFRPQQRFFRWWGFAHRNILKCFTHIFVQDGESKLLLSKHGIHNATVAGDTRFDRMKTVSGERLAVNGERLRPIAEFTEGCKQVIVAGSTWPKDEKLLAQFLNTDRFTDRTQNTDQVTKLVLVPHEIDEKHLHFIFNLFKGRFVRYSDVVKNEGVNELTSESRRNILQNANVLLVDTMGLLSATYPFGQVAYIGGGFGAGIHNTIEAAAYGKPVIFGPNYDHFREAKRLIEEGAARSIKRYSELEAALNTALDNYETIGAKASDYVQSELGATEKIFGKIFS